MKISLIFFLLTTSLFSQSQDTQIKDYFNNLKFDYGSCWDAIHRDKNVGNAIKQFNKSIPNLHVEGWVRHSDEFCIKVNAKDKATFDLASYEALVAHGLA